MLQVGVERIAGDADATLEVGDAQARVAGEDGEGADVGLDPPLPRRGEAQSRDPGREVLEAPHPAPPVAARVLDFVGRVVRAGTVLEPHCDGAVLDPQVAQQHQGRRPPRWRPAEPQQLRKVQLAVLVLDQVDVRVIERDPAQHDAARDKVEGVVVELGVRQPGHERRVGVVDHHVVQYDAGEQRAPDAAHLDATGHDAVERPACRGGEQGPPRVRAHQRGEAAERAGHQPDERPQRGAQRAAHHQNACPTANWKTILRQKVRGRGG